ncbi:uncharacterized protein LOC111040824 [Myzus persicae]|uniref:uncharacterized protein LOC111040824 n=1 Tax=Myzus persicae TaxID=13164 RepID=UPI000B931910|nr:uncharacterized protein LOC111040824 [Myzus persicae]
MVEKLVKDMTDTWEQYLCVVPNKRKTYEGDSGGPMICNGWQYGVCSFSLNLKGEDMQTIHIFIHYYRNWVNDIIETAQSTSITKQKRMKKYKTSQKSAAKLIIPHHNILLFMILGILCCNGWADGQWIKGGDLVSSRVGKQTFGFGLLL